jgi:SEC-C motif
MKIGLIQSRGIGDIVIALPIARYFVDRGDEVYWAIDKTFLPSFVSSAPYVRWLPLEREDDWYFDAPLKILQGAGCERIVSLYSYLEHRQNVINKALFECMKFDEYKYAVAGVPFREKWNLKIVRNLEREQKLFSDVVRNEKQPFAVAHLRSVDFEAKLDVEPLVEGCAVVHIEPLTDNIFDWLTVIERASVRVMIDSCFSNLTEQLGIEGKKYYIHRSPIFFSPVLTSDWSFISSRQTSSVPSTPQPDSTTASRRAGTAQPPYVGAARNKPCPCGSGKTFKHCHGKAA